MPQYFSRPCSSAAGVGSIAVAACKAAPYVAIAKENSTIELFHEQVCTNPRRACCW